MLRKQVLQDRTQAPEVGRETRSSFLKRNRILKEHDEDADDIKLLPLQAVALTLHHVESLLFTLALVCVLKKIRHREMKALLVASPGLHEIVGIF